MISRSNAGMVLVMLMAYLGPVAAGSLFETVFTAPFSADSIAGGDSLKISTKGTARAKIFIDNQAYSIHRGGRSPDIVSFGKDSFSLFWAERFDPIITGDRVYRQDISLTPNTYVLGSTRTVFRNAGTAVHYLHAGEGGSAPLITFLDSNMARGAIKGSNNNPVDTFRIGSRSNALYSSQIYIGNDTFLVAYADHFDLSRLCTFKIVSKTSSIDTVVRDTVQTIPLGQRQITNSSVSMDKNSQILILWSRGAVTENKFLSCCLYDRSLTALTDTPVIDDSICSPKAFYYFKDVQSASYAPGKFVAVHWDTSGIVLDTIVRNGATLKVDTMRLVLNSTCRFATLCLNDTALVVAWRGNSLGLADPNKLCIEAMRFSISGGIIDIAGGKSTTYLISARTDPITKVFSDGYNGEINCSMDTAGTTAYTWQSDTVVNSCIWANRMTYYRSGLWKSTVRLLPAAAGDSTVFLPGLVSMRNTYLGRVDAAVRAIRGPGDTTVWVPVLDSTALASSLRGVFTAYQYRAFISDTVTGSDTLLNSPMLDDITLRWDSKPVLTLDSIFVNRQKRPLATDTVHVMVRSDSLDCFIRLHDADTLDTIRFSRVLVDSAGSQFRGAYNFQFDSVFMPLPRPDTVYGLRLSARDAHGWPAVPRTVYVAAHNPAPGITARAAIDTNYDGTIDTLAIGAANFIQMQQTDSIEFFYSATDSNDPGIWCRLAIINGTDTNLVDSVMVGAGTHRYVAHGSAFGNAGHRIALFSCADPNVMTAKTATFGVNHPPSIVSVSGGIRNAAIPDGDTAWIAIARSSDLAVSVLDPDIPYGDSITYRVVSGSMEDSATVADSNHILQIHPAGADTVIRVIIHDVFRKADTLTFRPVNHVPTLRYVLAGGDTVHNSDTVRAIPGLQNIFTVVASDTDVTYYDSLTFTVKGINGADSVKVSRLSTDLALTPTLADSTLVIAVHDLFGTRDSLVFRTKHPWFVNDSAANPVFFRAADTLLRQVMLIDASGRTRQVAVPFVNSGNDSMSVVAVWFKGTVGRWLHVGLPTAGGIVMYDSLSLINRIDTIRLAPGAAAEMIVVLDAAHLRGDGFVRDTILVFTSDPLHPVDTIPVRLEHNDLPRLLTVAPVFSADRPYWLAKRKAVQAAYRFPPNAKLAITFTEAMDTATARAGLTLYSVFDRAAAGGTPTIPFDITWDASLKKATLSPHYLAAGNAHSSFVPPAGLFVPTDSIALVIASSLTDTANTSLAHNPLDVHKDFNPTFTAETTLAFRIDSISYMVTSFSPRDGVDTVAPVTPIIVEFSGPLYPGTIDTSRDSNKSLIVMSRFSGGAMLRFDSVRVTGSRATFYPAQRLFAGDSVWCRYRSVSGRDTLGYPTVAKGGSGIPVTLGDSSQTADDVRWYYKIRLIVVKSFSPDSASRGNSIHTTITLRFSDPVLGGLIDTDTGLANRSFRLASSFGGNEPLSFTSILFSADRTSITLVPRRAFFASDSVSCRFIGFSTDFRYDRAENYPSGTAPALAAKFWYFFTEDVGFYTYPNPYKPSIDKRHRSLDGIVFKNLHSLRRGINGVRVKIVDMNTNPVYDTRTANADIHFAPNDPSAKPQWKWDTKNQRGEFVASGVYLYVVYDLTDKALLKSKLIIIR